MDEERTRRSPLLAGRYRLIDQLGSGGMGVVWRALDELLDREVAVKEVRAPRSMGEEDVRLLYARLKQEARAAARVSHAHVITVHDVVEQQGRPWIVMELVRGRSLDEVLEQEGVLQPKEAARVGAMVLRALCSAHSADVLHRDVKPANVLMEAGGRVVLTDFGIAVIEGAGTLTRTGDLIGSPEFLAPERALGQRPGTPSDLWSLGATLYAAVEGTSPFRRTTALSTLQAVVQEELPQPRRAGPLTPLLEGLLRKDPRERMDAAEAQRLLDAVADGQITAPREWTVQGYVTESAGLPGPGYVPTVAAAATSSPRPQPPPLGEPSDTGPDPGAGRGVAAAAPGVSSGQSGAVRQDALHQGAPPAASESGAADPAAAALGAGTPPQPASDRKRRRVMLLLGTVLALLLAGGGTAAGVLGSRGTDGTGSGGSGSAPTVSSEATGGSSQGSQSSNSSPSSQPMEPYPAPTDAPAYGASENPDGEPTAPGEDSTEDSTGTCGGWVTTCVSR